MERWINLLWLMEVDDGVGGGLKFHVRLGFKMDRRIRNGVRIHCVRWFVSRYLDDDSVGRLLRSEFICVGSFLPKATSLDARFMS